MSASPLAHTGGGTGAGWPVVVAVLAAVTVAYLGAAGRARRDPRGWSGWRTAAFVTGVALLAVAAAPAVAQAARHDARAHMLQHLLVGMYAPLALVLAAPTTLALRTLPPGPGRRLGRMLRSRPAHLLGHPLTALLLTAGGLYLIYLTPLYAASQSRPLLHAAVHAHYLAAGYLFAWSIAGPDPAPRRPGMPLRVTALILAAGAHATLAKLLYARAPDWPPGAGTDPAALRDAAQLMYYGGDLAELLLAVALFATWYRRRARRASRLTVGVAAA